MREREVVQTAFLFFLSFFLTLAPTRTLRFFVNMDTRGGREEARLQQVMMYRGKFPAENYPRSHGQEVIIFFFETRRQTYAYSRGEPTLQQCRRDLLNY